MSEALADKIQAVYGRLLDDANNLNSLIRNPNSNPSPNVMIKIYPWIAAVVGSISTITSIMDKYVSGEISTSELLTTFHVITVLMEKLGGPEGTEIIDRLKDEFSNKEKLEMLNLLIEIIS